MAGIPTARETDSEDVTWALQTAEALWNRNERADAIVWLRRAAEAAAAIQDDDRALALARDAAELIEWSAKRSGVSRTPPSPLPPPAPPHAAEALLEELFPRPPSDSADEVTLSEISADPMVEPQRGTLAQVLRELALAKETAQRAGLPQRASFDPPPIRPAPSVDRIRVLRAALSRAPPSPSASSSRVPMARSPSPPPLASDASHVPSTSATLRSFVSPWPPPPTAGEVPTAAEVHAGMLDPWGESERSGRRASRGWPVSSPTGDSFDAEEVVTSAPPVVRPAVASLGPKASPALAIAPLTPAAIRESPFLDLSTAFALADLPDDEREAFARRVTVRELTHGEPLLGFALALVIEGSADVTAATIDSPALKLQAGAVVRGRGTIDAVNPLRIVASSPRARFGTWNEEDLAAAFRSCPWVEDELCFAGDRVQALVGATLGRLGERLDPELRDQVTCRLTLRVVAEHEILTKAGEPIAGVIVVGAGELELLEKDGTRRHPTLRPGDFLFPTEVLRASQAPSDVRAARGGALVLMADRALTQELFVTCPALLEIVGSLVR